MKKKGFSPAIVAFICFTVSGIVTLKLILRILLETSSGKPIIFCDPIFFWGYVVIASIFAVCGIFALKRKRQKAN